MPGASRVPHLPPLGGIVFSRWRARVPSVGPVRIAVAVFACVLAALVHVHLRLQVIELGYAISAETQQKHDLEDGNQKLRLELATRRDPAMIERRAREELRMAPADPASIRALLTDPVAVPAPAAVPWDDAPGGGR